MAKSESFVYSGHLYTAWSLEVPFCTPTPTEMIGACVLLSLIKLSFFSRIGSFPGVKLEANMFDCCSTAWEKVCGILAGNDGVTSYKSF